MFPTDLLYMQVLWISDDGIPDLGGTYEGETCFADEVRSIGLFPNMHCVLPFFHCLAKYDLILQVIQPALTYPGAYRRVSVELKVGSDPIGLDTLKYYKLISLLIINLYVTYISSADPPFGG